MGRSLVQGSPTEYGASDCDREALIVRLPWPTRGCQAVKQNMSTNLTKLKDLIFEIHLERKRKAEALIVLGYCVYRFVY